MNELLKVVRRVLLYIMIFVISLINFFWISGIYGLVIDLKYEEEHDGMFRGGYSIPYNHLNLLVRKKISDSICGGCTMIRGSTGMSVNCDDISERVEYESVWMGRYPQRETDEEPIEWLIIDEKGGRTLLLSKYYLDAVEYDSKLTNISWAESHLRKWLNNDFYYDAFNQEEQSIIKESLLESDQYIFDKWKGIILTPVITKDRIFVLDPHEKLIYLTMAGNDYHAEPTLHAKKQANMKCKTGDWSRFGAVPNIACQKYWSSWPVDSDWTAPGDYCLLDVTYPEEGTEYTLFVRPAMWVDSGYVKVLRKQQ